MRRLNVLWAMVLLLSPLKPANADARYTMEMTMQAVDHQVKISTVTKIKGQRERMDQSMPFGATHVVRTTITMCDKHKIVELCAPAKIYCVGPLDPMTRFAEAQQPREGHESGTGHIISTVTVTDRGAERVGQFHAHHYAVDTRIQSSGCVGSGDHTLHLDVWVAPEHAIGLNCPEMFQPSFEIDHGGCRVTYENRGDLDKMQDIDRMLVVRRIMPNPQGGSMTQRLVDFSEAPLKQADFEIPADYRQVSRQELQAAIQRQMMPPAAPSPAPQQ